MNKTEPTREERSMFQGQMFFAIQKINPMIWLDPEVRPKLDQLFDKHKSIAMMKAYKQQGQPDMLDFIDDYIQLSEINTPLTKNNPYEVRA